MRKINLLKRRREALDLKSNFGIVPSNKLLFKGSIIGSICIAPLFLIFFLVIFYNQKLLFEKDNLDVYSQKYDSIEKELLETNNLFKKLGNANEILMDSISGIRSGSGLFLEISKITPKLIELSKIDVGKTGVKIIGISPQKNGLKIINSYELSLAGSPFFNEKNIKILKASKLTRSDYSRIEKNVIQNKYLKFEIIAGFNDVNKSISSEYLSEIGSYGLANRLKIIDEIRQK